MWRFSESRRTTTAFAGMPAVGGNVDSATSASSGLSAFTARPYIRDRVSSLGSRAGATGKALRAGRAPPAHRWGPPRLFQCEVWHRQRAALNDLLDHFVGLEAAPFRAGG